MAKKQTLKLNALQKSLDIIKDIKHLLNDAETDSINMKAPTSYAECEFLLEANVIVPLNVFAELEKQLDYLEAVIIKN